MSTYIHVDELAARIAGVLDARPERFPGASDYEPRLLGFHWSRAVETHETIAPDDVDRSLPPSPGYGFDADEFNATIKHAIPDTEKIRTLLEWQPADRVALITQVGIVLWNYASRAERMRVWDNIADLHERIYGLENGLEDPGFDDIGDGMYGALDADQVAEQLRKELDQAIAAAAAHRDQ